MSGLTEDNEGNEDFLKPPKREPLLAFVSFCFNHLLAPDNCAHGGAIAAGDFQR